MRDFSKGPSPGYGDVISSKVRAARARAEVSQQHLAHRMNILGFVWYRQTVSNVESGRRRLLAEEVLALSLALETSMSDLLTPLPEDGADAIIWLPSGFQLLASGVRDSVGQGVRYTLNWSADDYDDA